MKRLLTILTFFILHSSLFILYAQSLQPAPKYASKVQKAIVSLNTYNKNGDLLKSGPAFYIGKDGEAIADYSLFKGAYKAMVIDASGKQYDVESILGADDTYSLVRFHVNTRGNAFLGMVNRIQSVGSAVYALNYSKDKILICPQGAIESFDSLNSKYAYYKLSVNMGDLYVGGPVFNDNGEVIGILQSALGKGINLRSYVMDIRFRDELKISAIQNRSAQLALSNIYIAKGLPDTQEECLVYAYFKSHTADNNEYMDIMNRFVAAFPQCAEAYYRRSTPLTDLHRFDEANADLDKYLSLAADKPVAHYNVAQSILNKLQFMPEPAYEKWTADLALSHVNQSLEMESAQSREESAVNIEKGKVLKAQILMFKKEYNDALSIYDELIAADPKNPTYLYAMSLVKQERGDSLTDVIADLDSAIAMFGDPMPAEAASYVLRRGQLYNLAGKPRNAVIDYNQYAYLLNSQVSDVFYYDRSQIELQARMFQQALDDINSAINIAPRNPLYHVEKAAMCLRFNMIDDCITSCNTALGLNANLPDAYRIRGYAEIQQNNLSAAKSSLQKAIDLGDEGAAELMKTYIK